MARRGLENDPGVGVTSRKNSGVGVGVDSRSGDISKAGVGGSGHCISENPGGIGDGGGPTAPNVQPVGLLGLMGLSEKFRDVIDIGDKVKIAGALGNAMFGGGPGVGGSTRVPAVKEGERGKARTVSLIWISRSCGFCLRLASDGYSVFKSSSGF